MKTVFKIYDQKGISLLEIMVGILILATGFLGVAKLQSQALKGVQWAQYRTTAILLAQSFIESIPFDELDNHHGTSNGVKFDIDNIEYLVTTHVVPLGTVSQKSVEINVAYRNQSVRIETLRFP